MSQGRRLALALWIMANAILLALLVLNPMTERTECLQPLGQQGCTTVERPLVERRNLVVAIIVGNGLAGAAWVLVGGD